MIRIAILDSVLPSQVRERPEDLDGIEVGWAGSSLDELRTVLPRLAPSVQVLNLDTLGPDPAGTISELQRLAGSELVIALYRYARRDVVERLQGDGRKIVKAPVSLLGLRTQMMGVVVRNLLEGRAGALPRPVDTARKAPEAPRRPVETKLPSLSRVASEAPPAARIFTDAQLGRLAERRSTVQCECPNHVSVIVQSLAAFEAYAAQCESRNEQDAAVHRVLGDSTKRARATMEAALRVLVEHEQIRI